MHANPEVVTSRRPLPIVTVAMLVGALCAHGFPAVHRLFVYDRALIAGGELWRLWSGHLAHHGLPHLLWNLLVFVPAGGWLEGIHPRLARTFFIAGPLLISIVLFAADPTLLQYAGLSGLAAGLVALLAAVQLEHDRHGRWFWVGVLTLLAVKLAYELATGGSAVAELPPDIRNVSLAHFAGVGGALALFAGFRLRERRTAGRVASSRETEAPLRGR